MPFELTEPTTATLNSVTPRTEKHGDEDVFAISLGVTITTANTILDKLSKTLRTTLYKPADETVDTLPGVEQSTPLLRTPGIDVLHLKGAAEGWTLKIDHGIDEEAPITLGGVKVDKFVVRPSEGGTVALSFRMGSSDISEDEIGPICAKLRQEITFTLHAPEIKKPEPVIDGSTEAFERDHPEARTAADLFAEQHGGDPDGQEVDPDDGQDGDGPVETEGGSTDAADVEAFAAGAEQAVAKARGGRRARAH